MARVCTVCQHAERQSIDLALIEGEPLREIASRYVPVSRSALCRHAAEHLVPELAKGKEAERIANADDLLAPIRFT